MVEVVGQDTGQRVRFGRFLNDVDAILLPLKLALEIVVVRDLFVVLEVGTLVLLNQGEQVVEEVLGVVANLGTDHQNFLKEFPLEVLGHRS